MFLSFSVIAVFCKKGEGIDAPAPGPDATYITDGVLCTMGTAYDSRIDTLRYMTATAGRTVDEYMYGKAKKKDEVYIVINSSNSVSILLKEPLIRQWKKL